MVVTALCCVKFYLFNALKTIFTLVSGYIPTVSVSLFKGFVKVSSPSQHVLTDQPRTRAWDFRNSTGSGAVVRG